MLLPGNSLPPSAPVKSRKWDTGKQIQHRGKICEGLLTSGYISVAFSFRNLNHSLSSPNHYHSDVDVSRHTPCHLIQISAWSSVEFHYVLPFVIQLFACARKWFTWYTWHRQWLPKWRYFTRWKFSEKTHDLGGPPSSTWPENSVDGTLGCRWEKLKRLKQYKKLINIYFP